MVGILTTKEQMFGPESWWQQFDYSGTDPFTGVDYPWWLSPFSTADSSDFPDWELFVEVFGVDKCYIQVQNTLIYNPIATAKWGAFILGIRNDWGGSCFGFAISSLLYFYHKSELISKFPNLSNQSQLFTVSLDSVSRRVVNHYFIHQFGIENTLYMLTHKLDSPRELLDELKNMFRNENGDGRALSYFDNSLFGTGGHSVTPFKMERLGSSSVFDLHLYDSRAPGVTTQVIQVDSGKNEWTDVTGLNYGSGSSGCYLEPESSEFFTTPSIVSPLSMLNPESSLSGGAGAITIYNTSQAEITITSSSGNQIGFQDSLVHNTFSDAVAIIPKTTSFHPPIGYLVPEDNYSILMNGYTDSLSYVFFFTDSTIYNYYRRTSLSDEEDYLNLNNGVVGITNPDQISKKIELETILVQNEVGEKVFFVSNINLSLNDSIKMHEVGRKNLLFQNYGDAMNYDLQVRSASANGQFIFTHISIPMAQNSAHQIVPVWNNLQNEPVKILIDLGNDGTIDDSIFVKNQTTGVKDEGSLLTPNKYDLAQNFPNPFNPATSIRYSIPQASVVTLKVYDILGNEVANLVNEEKDQGVYTVTFNAGGLSSGIYFYTLRADGFVQTKKMLLIK